MRETIPESIRIGATDFEVDSFSHMESDKFGVHGYFHYPSLQIRYQDDLPRQRLAEILIHETLHGIWREYELREDGENGREIEEATVTSLAKGLLQIIRDNPEFIAWISQSFPGETLERVPPLWEPTP